MSAWCVRVGARLCCTAWDEVADRESRAQRAIGMLVLRIGIALFHIERGLGR